jgi:hypothetical protein
MLKEKLPDGLVFISVLVVDSSGDQQAGRAAVKRWTPKESFLRGFRKAAKIVSVLIAGCLPFAFLEPFAFMVWGSLVIGGLVLVLGPFLHLKYGSEAESFFYVEAKCPHCQVEGKLNPYVSTAFASRFTLLCPACGQTCPCIAS